MSTTKKPPVKLISVTEFADLKGVTRAAVKYRIKNGDIAAEIVGNSYVIDFNKYQHLEFPNASRFVKAADQLTEI